MAIQNQLDIETPAGAEAGARPPPTSQNGHTRTGRLAQGLGWFSIGLGLTEMLAPRTLSKWIGVPQKPKLMRVMGAREFAAGVGILTRRRPAGWLWARAGGGIVDLALLRGASRSSLASQDRI